MSSQLIKTKHRHEGLPKRFVQRASGKVHAAGSPALAWQQPQTQYDNRQRIEHLGPEVFI